MTFKELLLKTRRNKSNGESSFHWTPPCRLLALDPGTTTGWAFFVDGELKKCGQCIGEDIRIEKLILELNPTVVVTEEYVLYPWAIRQQQWSDLPVSQLIGVIKFICKKQKVAIVMQGANLGKGFCKDARLRGWNYYITGKKHANDAIRHGCYLLLFGKS